MSLRQLRYFLTVAEELHFGRAAARLNISQPPLSIQIRRLEDELGFPLFVRSTRHVRLTAAGADYYDRISSLLRRLDEAGDHARRVAVGAVGRLELGFVGMAMDLFLPEILRACGESRPDVDLGLHELSTNEQLDRLRAGELDVGFIRYFGHELAPLESRVVARDVYVLAMPRGHDLAGCDMIRVAELADEGLIMSPRPIQPRLHDAFIRSFLDAGFSPRIVRETVMKKSAVALVAAGIGLALVPSAMARSRVPGVVYRPVVGNLPDLEFRAVWNPTRMSPALTPMLHLLARQADRSR